MRYAMISCRIVFSQREKKEREREKKKDSIPLNSVMLAGTMCHSVWQTFYMMQMRIRIYTKSWPVNVVNKMLPRTSPYHMNSLSNVPREQCTHNENTGSAKERTISVQPPLLSPLLMLLLLLFFITIFLSIKLLFWKCESFEFWYWGPERERERKVTAYE